MNKPKKAAKLIIKHTKGRINFNSVESWLLSIGYKIIFFNTIAGDVEISRYGLTEKAKIKKAFTYCGNAKIVFIDGTLPSEDKLYLLLHESGHIALGHLNLKRLSTENDTFLEFEADATAHILATYKRPNLLLYAIIPCIAVLVFVICAKFPNTTSTSITNLENTVYVTPTGRKYHRNTCIYVQNKTCTELDKSEAEKNYDSCSVCNP